MAWALWHAVGRRGIGWWLLLGALAALGMCGKSASALLLLVTHDQAHLSEIVLGRRHR